ncbi:MAG: TRAP transporter small permease [Syntrophobacteraceae bacterium]
MKPLINALACFDRVCLSILKVITIACLVFLTLLISANVFVRFVPVASLHWFDEIIELLYAYMVFYGSAAVWITREHFSVGDWLSGRVIKDEHSRHIYKIILELLCLVFVLLLFYYSLRLTIMARDVTNVFAIPKRILYSCLPVSGAIMVVSSIRQILTEILSLTERKGQAVAMS